MTSKQLKDLLNNMSKKIGISSQILQRNYMLEKLLERISLSKYKDNFILKGGMLVAAMVGVSSRSTMDLDTSIKNIEVTKEQIVEIINSLISMNIGDGIVMKVKDINEIREEFKYSCFRVSMEAKVENTIIPMKIDISTGDTITPSEVKYKFNLLLEKRSIDIWAYNIETVLAEKMETIISRSLFNTRMRDFYDVYILSLTNNTNINFKILFDAIEKTTSNRETSINYLTLENDLNNIFSDNGLKKLWIEYQKKLILIIKIILKIQEGFLIL